MTFIAIPNRQASLSYPVIKPGAATVLIAVILTVRECSGILRSRYSGKPGPSAG